MGGIVWQVLTGVIVIAIVMVLVRPSSPAATAVKNLSSALESILKTATGQT